MKCKLPPSKASVKFSCQLNGLVAVFSVCRITLMEKDLSKHWVRCYHLLMSGRVCYFTNHWSPKQICAAQNAHCYVELVSCKLVGKVAKACKAYQSSYGQVLSTCIMRRDKVFQYTFSRKPVIFILDALVIKDFR